MYEVASQIKQNASNPRPLLVAVTGYGHANDVQQVQQAGFDHHLLKPVRLEELIDVLKQAMSVTKPRR
ncbi:MAG: hypothetical protein HY308_05960 [Gammaproteobacteria bacterium]|nr:hypothetical protein [Gammaproteobacteria bacterium]